MIYLVLSVLASTGIFIVFKLFKTYKINTLQAIVVNYITAFVCGIIHSDSKIKPIDIVNSDWFLGVLILGFLFISVFNVMALTSQRNGLSVASVASKMSVIIPIIFGIYVYKESFETQKIIGILLALIAVYLTSLKPTKVSASDKSILLPILLFLGSGTIDTTINYFAPDDKIPLFSALIFGFAFIIGVCILIYNYFKEKQKFQLKTIPFGILLGLINYASIYFLLKALRIDGLESSRLFTINNVAIVAFSTLIGLVIFKEKIYTKNWIGICLAIISIALVTLA